MKRLIATRKRDQAFGRGDLTFVGTTNRRILAFVRRWHDQRMLVVTNLSRFVQHVTLDLADCAGTVPVEVFGRTPFPPIAGETYDLTLAPHTCLWFELTPAVAGGRTSAVPRLRVPSYEELFTAQGRRDLASVLPAYIERSTAWNAGSRTVIGVDIDDAIAVGSGADRRWLTVLHVTFASGEPERYLLPLGVRAAPRARPGHRPDLVAELVLPGGPPRRYELFDAAEDPVLAASVVRHDASPAQLEGIMGTLHIVVRDREAVSRAMLQTPSSMRQHVVHRRPARSRRRRSAAAPCRGRNPPGPTAGRTSRTGHARAARGHHRHARVSSRAGGRSRACGTRLGSACPSPVPWAERPRGPTPVCSRPAEDARRMESRAGCSSSCHR
jgi:hypothetical protein